MHIIYILEITDFIIESFSSAVNSYQDEGAYKMCVLQTLIPVSTLVKLDYINVQSAALSDRMGFNSSNGVK
jgi:hypothetical protein